MAHISDCILANSKNPINAENETLWLPSDFPSEDRIRLELHDLAADEVKLREGEAFDAIRIVQSMCKGLSALQADKKKQDHGMDMNLRSLDKIRDLESRRDRAMDSYNSAQQALVRLGAVKEDDPESPFPPLSIEDTYRKSTLDKRSLGDSRNMDGVLWRLGSIGTSSKSINVTESPIRELEGSVPSEYPVLRR
jgi:hypothetical protein